MRHLSLLGIAMLAAASCATSTSQKFNEQDFHGRWVEPIPGQAGVQGIALEEGGKAQSINMVTLRYESWRYENGKLMLSGTSIGNGVSGTFTDTLSVARLTADSLLLDRGEYRLHRYIRSKEECGFSANPGETVRGTIIFGHEVRAFKPAGSNTVYWLIDRSGYLQEKYKEAGVPEWEVEAELEVKNLGKQDDGFAADYDAAYQVLRVIKLGE